MKQIPGLTRDAAGHTPSELEGPSYGESGWGRYVDEVFELNIAFPSS